MWRKLNRMFLLAAVVLLAAGTAQAVTIDLVTVGNPGNAPDMRYNLDQRPEGYGAVVHLPDRQVRGNQRSVR